jgi:MFS superfamily sulfate permease-like transporter
MKKLARLSLRNHLPRQILRSEDLSAGIVVFLVALPLCLGIALASGAPLFSGIIAGIIGGIIISLFAGSPLSVSGPAAGLVVVVIDGIHTMGSFQAFCAATLLCGVFQVIFSILRLGALGEFVPSSVIKGMLAAIGMVIILKQIPHAVGWDFTYEGHENFWNPENNETTLSEVVHALSAFSPVATILSICSILILVFWETLIQSRIHLLKRIPAPLTVVLFGILYNQVLLIFLPEYALLAAEHHLVELPIAASLSEFFSFFSRPDFSAFSRHQTYILGATLAVVASIETLLSVEATDKLDPLKRISNTNRELIGQGTGNILSGLFGGLPITAVIVRSSANVFAGARTATSSFVHGVLLLFSALLIPQILNLIPLASLAAILLTLGFKLAHPKIFSGMYKGPQNEFFPFIVTVLAIIFTDLLIGVLVGLGVGILFVIKKNKHSAITVVSDGNYVLMRFNKDLSFLNRANLKAELLKIPNNSELTIDGIKASYIDRDILSVIQDFQSSARLRGIRVTVTHIRELENLPVVPQTTKTENGVVGHE